MNNRSTEEGKGQIFKRWPQILLWGAGDRLWKPKEDVVMLRWLTVVSLPSSAIDWMGSLG